MLRPILADDHIHPAVQAKVASHQQAIVKEVMDAVRSNDVVVVGGCDDLRALIDSGELKRQLQG